MNYYFILQSRDGIIKGQYPVSEKDAISFAALQCQIQLGKHDDKKHKSGVIEFVFFLLFIRFWCWNSDK